MDRGWMGSHRHGMIITSEEQGISISGAWNVSGCGGKKACMKRAGSWTCVDWPGPGRVVVVGRGDLSFGVDSGDPGMVGWVGQGAMRVARAYGSGVDARWLDEG